MSNSTLNVCLNSIKKLVFMVFCIAILASCVEKESNDKAIIEFSFSHFSTKVVGLIDESTNTIICNVPNKEGIESWTPTVVISDKATIVPAMGTTNDFSEPCVYTVIAENGSRREYTVKVLCTQNSIMEFSFSHFSTKVVGVIDESTNTIICNVPDKEGIELWTPTIIISDKATIVPALDTPNDFSEPCVYTVIAENGEIREYTVKALSIQNSITSYTIKAGINSLSEDIEAIITPNNEIFLESQQWIDNPQKLIATFESNGKEVKVNDVTQQSEITTNNFRKALTYTVIAESGDQQDYIVKFISPANTGLPIINVTTDGAVEVVNKVDNIKAVIQVIDDNDNYSFTAKGEIRGRGNSTLEFPKKPYRLKFDQKTSMFGLGAEKKWVLLANYQDPTFLMNSIAFEFGKMLGIPYTNHGQHVEVFLNGNTKAIIYLRNRLKLPVIGLI